MLASTNSLGIPLVTIILFVPGLAAVLCMLLDSFAIDMERVAPVIAVVAVVVDFVLSAILLAKFVILHAALGRQWEIQFADKHDWIPTLGISYWVGVDGVSVFLVPLTTLIMGVAIFAALFMIADRRRTFLIFMLLLETAVLGVFVAANLFLFFVFWEAMLIPMYFLLGIWGEERRVYATMKFLVYTIFGSFFMLVGIFYLWVKAGTLDMAGSSGLVSQLTAHPLSSSEQTWLFLAFGIAFAIKLPIFPFHSWAPTAYTASPIPVVIALSGILSKAGAFGFLRYVLPLFPTASRDMAAFVSILAVIGMLYAAGLALVQTDIKGLVAYASISHVNLIALGIFALNTTGLDGSVLQIVNHSVIITGLFLGIAYIAARTGTRKLSDLGGLGVTRPVLMWLFFVFILAGLDLPGLGSFAGEFLILAGTFRTNAWFATVATLTIIMAAWYMIRLFQNTMNGPVTASPQQTAVTSEDLSRTPYEYPVVRRLIGGDLLPREVGLLVPLILLIVYIGIQPDPLTARINPTADSVTYLVHHAVPGMTLGGGR
ncbi:MAG: NADH-quinone oxidoreductase subunit M [Chloroflexota bacterium]